MDEKPEFDERIARMQFRKHMIRYGSWGSACYTDDDGLYVVKNDKAYATLSEAWQAIIMKIQAGEFEFERR